MQQALIIDDSRAIRQILGGTVRGLGFGVIEATDGREALRALEAMSPPAQLVLVDWNMPVMNGLEFIQRVRSKPEWNSVKLMMVTSVTEAREMARALLAGADEYVMKPFTREILVDKLRLLGMIE